MMVENTELPNLDERCGRYLRFRDLVKCGDTQRETGIENIPLEAESYLALEQLACRVIDPIIEHFGALVLSYGFCSRQLASKIPGRIAPHLDQHAACERNRRGELICERRGAAADFSVPGQSMLSVAQWVVQNTDFDRLYFYGSERPIHVSVGPEGERQIVVMTISHNGRRIPRVTKLERFSALSD